MESMIGSKEQDEMTAALSESRWSTWPRHQLQYDDVVAKWACTVCWKTESAQRLSVAPCYGHSARWLPVQPGMEWARANSHHFWATGPWVWCSVCGAHTKGRNRWKLKHLAAGQDLNGRQPVDTFEVKRLRTAAVEEWRLQLGESVDPG